MRASVEEAIHYILQENDNDPSVSKEDWKDAVESYFDKKREEEERFEAWSDDAADYSSEGTDHVDVTVTSWDGAGHSIDATDFRLTPEEARSMFLGIRDRYNGGN